MPTYSQLIELLRQESDVVPMTLITVDHSQMASPLRFVNAAPLPFVSNGQTYLPAVFEAEISSDKYDEPPVATLTIAGTDGTILAAIQGLDPSPTFTLQLVFENAPDDVVYENRDFEVISFTQSGAASMVIEIGPRLSVQPFPGVNMDRIRTRALFTDL